MTKFTNPTAGERMQAADARWNAILQARPDLEPAVALQRQLIGSVVDLMTLVEQAPLPRLSMPPRYLASKLARGVPALTGEPVPVPAGVLEPTLLRLCDQLASGGAADAAIHIGAELREGRLDAGSLLAASLKRDQTSIRGAAVHRGLAPDLLWLVAELAVSPFAYALVQSIVRDAPEALADALANWNRGYCPACGSWPALAELDRLSTLGARLSQEPGAKSQEPDDRHRVLRCSFCATAWELDRLACIYCGEQGAPFSLTPDATGSRRLEFCETCHGYLKAVDVPSPSPFPLLAILDLETLDLDLMAMERGFERPTLKSLGA